MLALSLGLGAALIWAVHDFLARKLSQGAALLPMVAVVFAAGCVALLPLAIFFGDWAAMTSRAWAVAVVSGVTYALAGGSLYRAFSLAPARLVAPVIGAYPMLSLLIAVGQGRQVPVADWLAVVAIVAGIGIVALAARSDAPEGYAAPPRVAIGWAALAAVGFAATFALGQAAAREGSELPVMLIGRVVALAVILGLALGRRTPVRPQAGTGWILALMGTFDAVALGLVIAAGDLPQAEYASVASSLFGVLTVLLAAWFLREAVRPVQWLGIAFVFGGIAALGIMGA